MAGKVTGTEGSDRERAISRLASNQHGVVSLRQLEALGVSPRTVNRWAHCGRLRRLHRGVYALGPMPISRRGEWRAALLACGEDAVLSHGSAAALWGFHRDRGAADVSIPAGNRRSRPGIRLHRCRLQADEITVRDRIPTTIPERALFDLAEAIDAERLAYAWEEADRLHLLRLKVVARVLARAERRRAAAAIKPLLAAARAAEATRSPLEDRFAAFLRRHSLPLASHNVLILGEEVDNVWPETKLIAELDSWEHHSHRAAFDRDRAKDAARLAAGWRTIRVTHQRLETGAETLLAELRTLLDC